MAGERYRQDEREREREAGSLLCNRAFLSFVNKQERPVHTHTHTKFVTKYWHERVYFKGTPDS